MFWGLVASMWVGNCFLITLNVPLVRYWLSVFKIPYSVLFPSILFFCCIGTYSVNNRLDDVFITATFGFIGYVFMRLDLDAGCSLALFAIAALIPWLPLPSKRQPRHGGDALFVLLSAAPGQGFRKSRPERSVQLQSTYRGGYF